MATAGSLMVEIGMNVARLQQDARRATSIIETSTRQMTSSLNTFRNVAVAALSFAGISSAASVFTEYNKQMESAKIGIASLLATQGKFSDAQGNTLEGTKQIAAAYKMTSGILKQLEKDNLSTSATFGELRDAFQKALGPGQAANLNIDQIRQFSVAMIQAGKALGVPMDQMGQEVRSILTGNITEDSYIAKTLQITPEDIKKMKSNTTEFFQFLMGKLDGFKTFGKEIGDSYEGITSNVLDNFQKALGVGTQPFFEELKKRLVSVNEYLIRTNAETGQMEINPQFMKDIETLNTLLIAILDVGSAIGEVFTKIVIPPIRGAIDAAKSLIEMTGKSGFTGGGLEAFGQSNSTVAATDVSAMNRAADEYIGKIKEAQELIDRWKEGGLAGQVMGFFQIQNAEFDVSRYTEALQNVQRHLKEQGQDTQELERYIRSLKNETESLASDGIDAANESMQDFSYKANSAGISADELKKRLAGLKAQFKDVEQAQTSASSMISKNLEDAQRKNLALSQGWSPGRESLEGKKAEELKAISRFQEEGKQAGLSPAELRAYTDEMTARSNKSYEINRKNLAVMDQMAQARKSERAQTVEYDDVSRQVENYRRTALDAFDEITQQSRRNAEEMYHNSGKFYDAERVMVEGWVEESKKAFQDRVDSIGQSVQAMWKSINDARDRGSIVTPEAVQAVKDLEEVYKRLQAEIPTANAEFEKSAKIQLDQFKKMADVQGALDLSELNVSYAKLTATVQEQYQAQVDLIRANEAEKLSNASKDIPGLIDAYERLAQEQERMTQLHATGSWYEGISEGAKQIGNEIPTAFDSGIEAARAFRDVLDDAGDAFVDMSFSGKASFGDLISSMLKDLAKLAMFQATQGLFSSITSSVSGLFGGLFGGGKASGGYVKPFTSYLVGEKGPELLTMGSSGGNITPNGAIGGQQITVPVMMEINLNSNGGSTDPSHGRQIGEEAAKAFESRVIQIVQNQMRPGNMLNRGIRG